MTTRGDFTPQADAYAKARPTYPSALVNRLLADALAERRDARIVDLGAGTGLFTERLITCAPADVHIQAIEPNAAMRAKAPALANVEWSDGTFEATDLASDSVDWTIAAHAFHWADPWRALPEIRRVLRADGRLTVLWNVRDVEASEILRFTRGIIEESAPGFDEGYRARDWASVLVSTDDFASPDLREETHFVEMDRERYLNLWRSHHLLRRAIGEAGIADLLARLENRLSPTEIVRLPYVCRAWTATPASGDLAFRHARPEDAPMMRRWDEQPHIDWDDDWQWETDLGRKKPWREQLIAELEGRPIGFVQIIDPAKEEEHYWGDDVEADLRAIDIWIGESTDLGRGYGTRMMRQALARCFAEPEVKAVLVDPLASNTRGHRFYERMGFRRVEQRYFDDDECFVYRKERLSEELKKPTSAPS